MAFRVKMVITKHFEAYSMTYLLILGNKYSYDIKTQLDQIKYLFQ